MLRERARGRAKASHCRSDSASPCGGADIEADVTAFDAQRVVETMAQLQDTDHRFVEHAPQRRHGNKSGGEIVRALSIEQRSDVAWQSDSGELMSLSEEALLSRGELLRELEEGRCMLQRRSNQLQALRIHQVSLLRSAVAFQESLPIVRADLTTTTPPWSGTGLSGTWNTRRCSLGCWRRSRGRRPTVRARENTPLVPSCSDDGVDDGVVTASVRNLASNARELNLVWHSTEWTTAGGLVSEEAANVAAVANRFGL